MTVTDQMIREAFERIEAERGGPQKADAKSVLWEVAAFYDVSYQRVRDVMLATWGAQG
jgi:hypothetical protein